MADAVKILRGLEELYPEMRFVERLRHCIETYPNENWEDAMSRGQITSKQWILHELQMMDWVDLGSVVVCGGWLGILSRILLDSPDISTRFIASLDISMSATISAGELNKEYVIDGKFMPSMADCTVESYRQYDTIINTSCEHFADFRGWWDRIPSGRRVILQSNNFFGPEDHINIVTSVDQLIESVFPIRAITYAGKLPTHKYDRFMVIGIK